MYIPLNSYIFSKTSKVKVGLLTHFFGKSLFEIYKFEDKIAKPILLTNTPLGCLLDTGSPTVFNTCRWVRLPLSDSVEPEWSWISPREARLEAAERMIHNHEAETWWVQAIHWKLWREVTFHSFEPTVLIAVLEYLCALASLRSQRSKVLCTSLEITFWCRVVPFTLPFKIPCSGPRHPK